MSVLIIPPYSGMICIYVQSFIDYKTKRYHSLPTSKFSAVLTAKQRE